MRESQEEVLPAGVGSHHTSGFLSTDRAAAEPYVFAAENGNPMKYFRYVRLPYAPPRSGTEKFHGPSSTGKPWRAITTFS